MTSPPETAPAKAARIILVDDHPIVREGLAEVINRDKDLAICAQAEDRLGALDAVEKTRPDLVIIDLTLKNSNGLELIKDIRVRWPHLLILVVSMHDEMLYAERVLRAGAQGYITKQEAAHDILLAIRRILGGAIYLNDKLASTILTRLAHPAPAMADSIAELLADRELQVFELTGRGWSTREIAHELGIDMKTIDTYRSRIREKLSLKTSSELLQLAIRWSKDR